MTGSPSNLNISFNGLTANTVYDARIVLADFSGRTSTNEWTFDTFSEAFFSSGNVKVIEVEDYNYESGKFQNDPPPSGFDNNGGQVRGNGAGYLGLIGTPDVDYFDRSTSVGSGVTPDYRGSDNVGTARGAIGQGNTAEIAGVDVNDTRRQKYVPDNLEEYEVRRTEGGEWLNYTRNFASGNYNVYLRVACRAAQTVNLDRVTSDPSTTGQTTSPLGIFRVPSTSMLGLYRYVPLTDASGNAIAVPLAGTNTLRLTIGGAATNVTQYTMYLNYLALVPVAQAALFLQSAAAASGSYADDAAANHNDSNRTFTVPISGNARYYRIRRTGEFFATTVRITGVTIVGANAIITYAFDPI
jgi:hypothetical protein